MNFAGKYLIIIGGLILIAGLIIWLFGDKLTWLGNLPGDIKIERENLKIYFPLTTMIFLSIVLSIIIWLIRKLFG